MADQWQQTLKKALKGSELDAIKSSESFDDAGHKLFPTVITDSQLAQANLNDPHDPIVLQYIPQASEQIEHPDFKSDPVGDMDASKTAGLIHKYHGRVLLIVSGSCAVNCRYCFRRHFPYQDNKGSKTIWQESIDYIANHPEVNEVIFSGGDPLMAKDHELTWLIQHIEAIPHIKRLRIHSRLPVVIPNRITDTLCQLFKQTRLQIILVTHINHANEINFELVNKMTQLKQSNVTLLNQSVLLKDVNDTTEALTDLSEALFDAGILPYYLHVLDKVQGAAHFFVSDEKAKQLMGELIENVSGYLVPTLAREIGGRKSKTPLDLYLE